MAEPEPAIIDGKPHFRVYRRFQISGDEQTNALLETVEAIGEPPIYALLSSSGNSGGRATGFCSADLTVTQKGIARHAYAYDPVSGEVPGGTLSWATWREFPAWNSISMPRQSFDSDVFAAWLGNGSLFAEVKIPAPPGEYGGLTLASFAPSTGEVVSAFEPGSRIMGNEPTIIDEGALFATNAGRIYFMPPDGRAVPIRAARPGFGFGHLFADRTRASQLAWVEVIRDGLDFFEAVLWTSPLSTGVLDSARAVAALPNLAGTRAIANAGMFAYVRGTTEKEPSLGGRLVRISDGQGWDIPSEPDLALVSAFWVDDDYVYFEASTEMKRPWSHVDALVRIARSSLGVPTIANGL